MANNYNVFLVIIGLAAVSFQLGFASKLQQEICQENCNKIYDPVCAYNGTGFLEYANKCILEAVQCRARNAGTFVPVVTDLSACTDDVPSPGAKQPEEESDMIDGTKRCPNVCPTIYSPICALLEDYVITYSNSCFFGIAVCEARKKGTPLPVLIEKNVCGIE